MDPRLTLEVVEAMTADSRRAAEKPRSPRSRGWTPARIPEAARSSTVTIVFEQATPWDIAVRAVDLRDRLSQLYTERTLALGAGLGAVPSYMTDLEGEISQTRELYVGAAVTEIATLRSELFGAYQG